MCSSRGLVFTLPMWVVIMPIGVMDVTRIMTDHLILINIITSILCQISQCVADVPNCTSQNPVLNVTSQRQFPIVRVWLDDIALMMCYLSAIPWHELTNWKFGISRLPKGRTTLHCKLECWLFSMELSSLGGQHLYVWPGRFGC